MGRVAHAGPHGYPERGRSALLVPAPIRFARRMAENHTEPTVVALSGDIDLLTAPAVTAALDALT